jgi:ADP-ribosylglycohydrolase
MMLLRQFNNRVALSSCNRPDTTAAIAGQIAGAYYGVEGIPSSWLEKLAMKDEIFDIARKLTGVSKS